MGGAEAEVGGINGVNRERGVILAQLQIVLKLHIQTQLSDLRCRRSFVSYGHIQKTFGT